MKQKGPELELVTQSCHFCLAERESEKKKRGGMSWMEIINRGKQKQFLSSALGFTDGKLKTHLHIVHVVNSGKDTREREREIYKDKERY